MFVWDLVNGGTLLKTFSRHKGKAWVLAKETTDGGPGHDFGLNVSRAPCLRCRCGFVTLDFAGWHNDHQWVCRPFYLCLDEAR